MKIIGLFKKRGTCRKVHHSIFYVILWASDYGCVEKLIIIFDGGSIIAN